MKIRLSPTNKAIYRYGITYKPEILFQAYEEYSKGNPREFHLTVYKIAKLWYEENGITIREWGAMICLLNYSDVECIAESWKQYFNFT